MPYPIINSKELSEFSGRPAASYTDYIKSAASQALLLFKLGTCLHDLPDDPIKQELAKFALLAMTDKLFLAQRYQAAQASPFSSESIGSYSYSKAAQQVTSGEKTGVMWFDVAVSELGVCDTTSSIPTYGGISMNQTDGLLISGRNGSADFLGPAELDLSRTFGFDPAPGYGV